MKIYVSTYEKYNNANLDGEWVDLDDFESKDEFYKYCQELHNDESDPEFMFQDYEIDYDIEKQFYGECHIDSEYWDFARLRDSENDSTFQAICDYMLEESIEFSEDNYRESEEKLLGCYQTTRDFFQEMVESQCNIPNWLDFYIDYEKMEKDDYDHTFIETNKYWKDSFGMNQHYIAVFRNY